jgi:Predicted transcriptional regulator
MLQQRLIDIEEVKQMAGIGTTSVYDKMKTDGFPKPVKLGRMSRWVESEVQAWIAKKIHGCRLHSGQEARAA